MTDSAIAKAHLADALAEISDADDYDYLASVASQLFEWSSRAAHAATLYAKDELTHDQFINDVYRAMDDINWRP